MDTSIIINKYIIIAGTIYKIIKSNINNNNSISLFNEMSKKFLKHSKFLLIEKEYNNNQLFNYDSSFIPYEESNGIILFSTNENLKSFYITTIGYPKITNKYDKSVFKIYDSYINAANEIKFDNIKLIINNTNSILNELEKYRYIEKEFNELKFKIDILLNLNNINSKDYIAFIKPSNELYQIHKLLFFLLKNFKSICKINSIDYWLDFGTLLGSIRHKSFIPWDDDADVGMLKNDIIKLKNILRTNEDFKIEEILNLDGNNQSVIHFYRFTFKRILIPIFVDIFVYYKVNIDFMYNEKLNNYYQLIYNKVKKLNNFDKVSNIISIKNDDYLLSNINKFELSFMHDFCNDINDKFLLCWGFENFSSTKVLFDSSIIYPLTQGIFNGESFSIVNNYDEYLKIRYGNYLSLPNNINNHSHYDKTDELFSKINKVINIYKI